MRGLLVTNSFLKNAKFGELYAFFASAAKDLGIRLDACSSDEIFLPVGQKLRQKYDFALFWDKDLFLCRALEAQGIRVFNSSRAIELCDDKALTAEALVQAGVKTPKTLIAPKTYSNVGYTNDAFLARAERYLSYPFVIKHRFGSFGAQVFLAHDRTEAAKICQSAAGNEVILQEFVAESAGRDLRVNVVGGRICGVMYRHSDNDFRSNITLGGTPENYTPDRKTEKIALAAAKSVRADFAGVDVLFGKNGPVVCEVNASPHFKTTLVSTGIDLSREILSYIIKSVKT